MSVLVVGALDVHERYVFVAVTSGGVEFAVAQQWVCLVLGELDGFLRTVLYAGKAELTFAAVLQALRAEFIVAAGADRYAGTAADAGVGDIEVVFAVDVKSLVGVDAGVGQEAGVLLALLISDRLVPLFSRG